MTSSLAAFQSVFLCAGILFLSSAATEYVQSKGFFVDRKGWQVTIVCMHCSPLLLAYVSSEEGWNPIPIVWILISWWLRGGTSASGVSVYSLGLAAMQFATLGLLQVGRACPVAFSCDGQPTHSTHIPNRTLGTSVAVRPCSWRSTLWSLPVSGPLRWPARRVCSISRSTQS